MSTINKSGEKRKNSSPGRTLFNFKMLDELKLKLQAFAWIRTESVAGILEKAAEEYIMNHPLSEHEKQMLLTKVEKYPGAVLLVPDEGKDKKGNFRMLNFTPFVKDEEASANLQAKNKKRGIKSELTPEQEKEFIDSVNKSWGKPSPHTKTIKKLTKKK